MPHEWAHGEVATVSLNRFGSVLFGAITYIHLCYSSLGFAAENYQIFVTLNPLLFFLLSSAKQQIIYQTCPGFNRTSYRMLKMHPKQALHGLIKTVEIVNKSFALVHFELVYINMTSATLSPASHCLSADVVTLRSWKALADHLNEMLAFYVSPSHSKFVHVLLIVPAFIQYVPNHVHIACSWDDSHVGRWTERSMALTAAWGGCRAGDPCSRRQFNIRVPKLDFQLDVGTYFGWVCGNETRSYKTWFFQ